MNILSDYPTESLYNTIVFDPRDWSENCADSWIWGIVVGWDEGSLKEIQFKFKWSDYDVNRLTLLNKKFKELHNACK